MKNAIVALCATAAISTAPAWAAPPRMTDIPANTVEGRVVDGEGFGITGLSVEQVFSFGFQTLRPDVDVVSDNGNGYLSFVTPGPSGALFISPVHLPSGVEIDFIALNYCDASAGTLTLTMYDSFGDNQFSTIGSITPPDRVGCGYAISPELNFQYDANSGHLLSFYVFQNGGLNGGVRFRGAEVHYRRKVAAAPAVATFPNDVPTTHPQFRFIEALAAVGVTGGCGAGAYCPDAAVTRGQMAVFLSVALGLHFPN